MFKIIRWLRKLSVLWKESSGSIPLMIIIAFILFLLVGYKRQIIPTTFTDKHKLQVEVISKVIETIVVICGGFLAYFRYFKGRTFSPKLIICPECSVIKMSDGSYRHFLDIEIKNAGSVCIWNYKLTVTIFKDGSIEKADYHLDFYPVCDLKSEENLIDVGENTFQHGTISFDNSIQAITYLIEVSLDNDNVWNRVLTVKNQEESRKV